MSQNNRSVVVSRNAVESLKINFEESNPTVSGRELHIGLEVETPYHKWIARMLEYGFEEGKDYHTDNFVPTVKRAENGTFGGKDVSFDHRLSLDCAKEICMIQRTPIGKRMREYFIECEKKFWEQQRVLTDNSDPMTIMSKALIIANNHLEDLRGKNVQLREKVEHDAPKVEFYDKVANTESLLSFKQVADMLAEKGFGRNNLMECLRNMNVLNSKNEPYRYFVEHRCFVPRLKYIEKAGKRWATSTTYVTVSGINFLRKLIEKVKENPNAHYKLETVE